MKKVSYASTANDDGVQKEKSEQTVTTQAVAEIKPIEYMDVTALMNMLDKNRGQQPDEEGETLVLDPQQEEKPAPNSTTADIKELLLDLPKSGAKKSETKQKKSSSGSSAPAKSKKKSSAKSAEPVKAAEPATEKDMPVPAAVAVARLQVERNAQRHSRDLQVKTLKNSRRSSPVSDPIAPVEYATLATLTAVAVAVLVAIFYLVNDKGEIQPAVTPSRVNQMVVVHDKTNVKGADAAAKKNGPATVETELLNILNQ